MALPTLLKERCPFCHRKHVLRYQGSRPAQYKDRNYMRASYTCMGCGTAVSRREAKPDTMRLSTHRHVQPTTKAPRNIMADPLSKGYIVPVEEKAILSPVSSMKSLRGFSV